MKIMMTMLMINSTMFSMLKHPLSMGMSMIIQTMLMAIMMNWMIHSPWYSYMRLVMIMLGGMLIFFMYMASIASNEMIKISMMLFL